MNMMIGIVTLILKEWQVVKESGIRQSALYPSLGALNDRQATISPVSFPKLLFPKWGKLI